MNYSSQSLPLLTVCVKLKAGEPYAMDPWIIRTTVIMLFICCCQPKRDRTLFCSACHAIIDELTHSIDQVDPKQTINIGSFRLNPDGSMKDKKVPLARSETHLSELLDGVCHSMSDYALYVDPDTQKKQYMRFVPRSSGSTGDFPDLENFQFDGPEVPSGLKFTCETIVEELEDDIIALFSQNSQDAHNELCNNVSDYCKDTSNTDKEL
ncbi:protein canopy-1 isoform X1 [Syngnathoides biaculeatus]|uniref:protein canopy-1 isoform X1 n=1 Tax=Syngnathoides biaculeatus TaxID=300417 RepID=UPI002ADD93BB|nr:protein canopy-1 isoform X1 [Syngnathoides biaculeatus]